MARCEALSEKAMSKPRVTTDEQCAELAAWFADLRRLGTVQSKARDLGISVSALYDAIARGQGRMTAGARMKISSYRSDLVPRESNDSESIAKETA